MLALSGFGALGQPAPSPAPQDPLMALMLSQPHIDVDSPVTATAAFDPPVLRPGELSIYRVTFNALEQSIDWPGKILAAPQLDLRPGAHGQIFQMAGANLQPRTAFNYHVRPLELGQFTVPEFTVTVYGKPVTVPAARLDVAAAPPAAATPPQVLHLVVAATNLYVGQSVRASLLFPGLTGGLVQGLAQAQLTGQGILNDQSAASQRFEQRPPPGSATTAVTLIYETSLTPISAGRLSVLGQGFTAGFRSSGPIILKGPVAIPAQYTLLDSEPVELDVRPLPREGRLPGFTGAIGALSLETPTLTTNVARVGEPLKLTVKVRGDTNANLARLVAPPPPRVADWQVFAANPGGAPLRDSATFSYTLIPLAEETRATPAIPFSYFDPKRGAYTDLTVPPVPLTVKPAAVPADLQALRQADSSVVEPEKEPVLSGLAVSPGLAAASLSPLQQQAWFPLVQLAPAAAFFGLWSWDRRRRYLEQHPDLVLRRRARRALRRERRALEKAVRAGDAAQFAAVAVQAMRVACAPHYPAQPRALVGGDVLSLLSDSERSGRPGEVVRRFFGVADAARFATAPADARELLALRPDFERLLKQLEDRL